MHNLCQAVHPCNLSWCVELLIDFTRRFTSFGLIWCWCYFRSSDIRLTLEWYTSPSSSDPERLQRQGWCFWEHEGAGYWDDFLTPVEVDLLCGVYMVERGKCVAVKNLLLDFDSPTRSGKYERSWSIAHVLVASPCSFHGRRPQPRFLVERLRKVVSESTPRMFKWPGVPYERD